MDSINVIEKYFPGLSGKQREQFEKLGPLYADWNSKINVISRKDIDNLYTNHILHSLAIAKFLQPAPGTTFLDMGTGGGFPGIPLAIMYPECRFHLIDRIGKKIKVAQAIAEAIGLTNVTFQHGDIGECRQKYDYVVSRAVMRLDELLPQGRRHLRRTARRPCRRTCRRVAQLFRRRIFRDEKTCLRGNVLIREEQTAKHTPVYGTTAI